MTTDLEAIKNQIKVGDIQEARRSLQALTAEEPLNANAWELLADISTDPNERAECYRRILQIDPGNRQIAVKLLEITGETQDLNSQKRSFQLYDPIIYCKQCGGPAEVHFVGDLQDKRAICSYCGTEVDLPDSYQRIQKLREHQQLPGGGDRTIEKTVIETRQDDIPGEGDFESYPPELKKIIQILSEKGTADLSDEQLKELHESGITLSFVTNKLNPEEHQALQKQDEDILDDLPDTRVVQTQTKITQEKSRTFLKLPFFKRKRGKRDHRRLSLEEIVMLKSDPLPPEERRNCPNPVCGAVIPKSATECPWCGQSL
jgi:hypothetical protein